MKARALHLGGEEGNLKASTASQHDPEDPEDQKKRGYAWLLFLIGAGASRPSFLGTTGTCPGCSADQDLPSTRSL